MDGRKRKYHSCNSCIEADECDDMVCCDNCQEWYHYKCAGVGPEINTLNWICQICLKIFIETFELAKAAENSIVRKLEKRSAERGRNVVDGTVDLSDKAEKKKSDSTSEQRFQNDLGLTSELEKMIVEKVEIALARRLEGLGANASSSSNATNGSTVDSGPREIDTEDFNNLNSATVDSGAPEPYQPDDIGAAGFEVRYVSCVFSEKNLPVEQPSQLEKLELELVEKHDYFDQKLNPKGSTKLYPTMRLVSNKIISDNVLKLYSYEGRRRGSKSKLPFKVFENVTKLIVKKTMDAFNQYNAGEPSFQPISEDEVRDFFKSSRATCG